MFNTNVGDMPLDIFSDYILDTINQEWDWIYLLPILNFDCYGFRIDSQKLFGSKGQGNGIGGYSNGIGYHIGINFYNAYGDGLGYGDAVESYGNGFGYEGNDGIETNGNGFHHNGCG